MTQVASTTARQKLDEFRRSTARATNEKVILFEEVGEIVLNPEITNEQLRRSIHEQISPEKMRVAVDECKRLRRPPDDNYYEEVSELRTRCPKRAVFSDLASVNLLALGPIPMVEL